MYFLNGSSFEPATITFSEDTLEVLADLANKRAAQTNIAIAATKPIFFIKSSFDFIF